MEREKMDIEEAEPLLHDETLTDTGEKECGWDDESDRREGIGCLELMNMVSECVLEIRVERTGKDAQHHSNKGYRLGGEGICLKFKVQSSTSKIRRDSVFSFKL